MFHVLFLGFPSISGEHVCADLCSSLDDAPGVCADGGSVPMSQVVRADIEED